MPDLHAFLAPALLAAAGALGWAAATALAAAGPAARPVPVRVRPRIDPTRGRR